MNWPDNCVSNICNGNLIMEEQLPGLLLVDKLLICVEIVHATNW